MNERLAKILDFFRRKPAADKAPAAALPPYDPSRSPLLQARAPVIDQVPPVEAQPVPAAEGTSEAAPVVASEAAPVLGEVELLQLKTADLETRLSDAQERISKLAAESDLKDEAQRQALGRAEEALREFMAEQKAAQESDKTGERLTGLEDACRELGAGAAEASSRLSGETARVEEKLVSLVARMDSAELKFPEIAATRDSAALLVERFGGVESRLSMAEALVGEVSVRGGLRDKLNARDFLIVRERVEEVGKNIAALAYLEKRLETVESDSRRVMRLEGGAGVIAKRMEKLEADLCVLAREQVAVSEENRAGGAAIEELKAKFANISVVFEYLRKETNQIKDNA